MKSVIVLALLAVAGCAHQAPPSQRVAQPAPPRPPMVTDKDRLAAFGAGRDARQAQQGPRVRHLPRQACDDLTRDVPPGGIIYTGRAGWEGAEVTRQEAWCLGTRPGTEMVRQPFPGMLPAGVRAYPLGNGAWWIEGR